MNQIKQIIRRLPGVSFLHKTMHSARERHLLRTQSPEQVFRRIYQTNTWGSEASRSGTGSDDLQTEVVQRELPRLCDEFGIQTILDIPCGDFHWMRSVELNAVNYLGADIVDELIHQNRISFSNHPIQPRFEKLDLIKGDLPKVDLVFCRDCLVHLSFENVFRALDNLCRSQSSYFLTTTFPEKETNKDILTGEWRVLNLQKAPFGFPTPLKLVVENCTEGDGVYRDKSLALWKMSTIQECLESNSQWKHHA